MKWHYGFAFEFFHSRFSLALTGVGEERSSWTFLFPEASFRQQLQGHSGSQSPHSASQLWGNASNSQVSETALISTPTKPLSNKCILNLTQIFPVSPLWSVSHAAVPGDSQPEQTEAEAEQDDASSKLSLSEKLALFNKLSQPLMPRPPGGPRGPEGNSGPVDASERRRQKGARYRTQPITADEVSLVSVCVFVYEGFITLTFQLVKAPVKVYLCYRRIVCTVLL